MYIYKTDNTTIDVSGEWTSNFNNMVLYQIGDRVIGKYDLSGGIIEGTLKDNVLTGVWYQLVGSADCTYGPVRLEFTENAFMGEWGYCKDPTPKGFWMGNRK
jgi:hypothetical protein